MSKKTFIALLCIAFAIVFFSLSVFSDKAFDEGTNVTVSGANTTMQTVTDTTAVPTTSDAEPYEASGYAKTLAIVLSSAFVVFALIVAIKRPKD